MWVRFSFLRREQEELWRYLPVQQGLFDKHVHGVEQQIRLGPVRSQGVDHDALDQARLPQRLHEVDELLGQPERHELRHGEELRGQRGDFIEVGCPFSQSGIKDKSPDYSNYLNRTNRLTEKKT